MNKLLRKTVITIEDYSDVDDGKLDTVAKRENTTPSSKDCWLFDITYVLNNDKHCTYPDKIVVDKGTPKFMVEEILHNRSKENYRKTGYICYMENLRKAN